MQISNSGLQCRNVCTLCAGQRLQSFDCRLCLVFPCFESGNVGFESSNITCVGINLAVCGVKTCFQGGHSVLQLGDCGIHCSISRFKGGFESRVSILIIINLLKQGLNIGLCGIQISNCLCKSSGICFACQSGFYSINFTLQFCLCGIDLIVQFRFVALVVGELCIDGGICGNGISEIKRGLICSIRKPAHKDVAVNYGVFKRNRITLDNRNLAVVNTVNAVVYDNVTVRNSDLDVLGLICGICGSSDSNCSCCIFTRINCQSTIECGSIIESHAIAVFAGTDGFDRAAVDSDGVGNNAYAVIAGGCSFDRAAVDGDVIFDVDACLTTLDCHYATVDGEGAIGINAVV